MVRAISPSPSRARKNQARALTTKAAEELTTSRETAVAEREKAIQLIEARKAAEQQAI
jgi:uncharacterized membrane protein YqiK